MARPIPIGVALLAISLAATLGGCGDTEATGDESFAKASDQRRTEILAVQTGSEASLRRREDDAYELRIHRPSPRTLYFTDSPARKAQTAPVGRFATWVKRKTADRGYPANVAVSWSEPGGPGALVATLRDIEYERGAGRLRATLDPLSLRSGATAVTRDGQAGLEPFSNRSVSVVVDGFGGYRCFAEIYTGEGDFWTLEKSSVENNDWDRPPPETFGREAIIGAESTNSWYGCEFSARYSDGEGSGFVVKVDNPFVGSQSYSCQGFGEVGCDAETLDRDSGNEALLQAQIYYKK